MKNSDAWSTDRLEVNVIRQVANTEIDAAYLLEDNDSRIVQLVEAKWEDQLQSAECLHGLNQVQRQSSAATPRRSRC